MTQKTLDQRRIELESEILRITDEISLTGKSDELSAQLQEVLRRAKNLRADQKELDQ